MSSAAHILPRRSILLYFLALCGIVITDSLAREVELIEDTRFSEGFGASWYYGSKFSSPRHREGRVLAYRSIPPPDEVWLIPGQKVSGLTKPIEHRWDFEEGLHHDFTDPINNKRVSELHRHRFVVNHKLEADTPDNLQFSEFNNEGLESGNPDRDTRFVKRITSNRQGTLQIEYNSQNEIRNAASVQTSQWARDTWPHLLPSQTFRDMPKPRDFERLDMQLTFRVDKLNRLSQWLNDAASMNFKYMFFLRDIENPDQALFVGMMMKTGKPAHYEPLTAAEQHGAVVSRGSITQYGPVPEIGETRTVKRELIEHVRKTLIEANKLDPKLSTDPDDYYLFNIAIGWEGLGHWEADLVMKDLSLKGVLRKKD